jgi:hypothetical protein
LGCMELLPLRDELIEHCSIMVRRSMQTVFEY